MAKTKTDIDLELLPRVSILEKSQEAIQRDLSNLTHSVQKQGEQLTFALTQLSNAQNANFNALNEKIGISNKTDWPTLLTGAGIVILLVGGLMTHIYTQFASVDKEQIRMHETIRILEERSVENKIDIGALKANNGF
jgi:hypothetical protein